MTQSDRSPVPDGTYFFTLRLADPAGVCPVDQAPLLRAAIEEVRGRHPFVTDAEVILPDLLHAIWVLPDGDVDYLSRWAAIKDGFARRVAQVHPILAGAGRIRQPPVRAFAIRSPADLDRHRRICRAARVWPDRPFGSGPMPGANILAA